MLVPPVVVVVLVPPVVVVVLVPPVVVVVLVPPVVVVVLAPPVVVVVPPVVVPELDVEEPVEVDPEEFDIGPPGAGGVVFTIRIILTSKSCVPPLYNWKSEF